MRMASVNQGNRWFCGNNGLGLIYERSRVIREVVYQPRMNRRGVIAGRKEPNSSVTLRAICSYFFMSIHVSENWPRRYTSSESVWRRRYERDGNKSLTRGITRAIQAHCSQYPRRLYKLMGPNLLKKYCILDPHKHACTITHKQEPFFDILRYARNFSLQDKVKEKRKKENG